MNSQIARVFLIALSMLTSVAHAAGTQTLRVPSGGDGRPPLSGKVWYPCSPDSGASTASTPCPIPTSTFPLIIISHGAGGDFNGHHDTAEALADHGFIVAAINHPGDTARDHSEIGSLPALLVGRPSDMKRLIDFMLKDWPNASRIDAHRIGFFGFSRGALTGLILAGGQPDMHKMAIECEADPDWGVCRNPTLPSQPLPRDPRIHAMVLADPVFGAMFANGLSNVSIPIQLWASEYGGDGVTPADAKGVDDGLPTTPPYTIVPNATHFAFLAPCSQALAQAVPQICTDKTGFDRKQFHETFNTSVVTFFEQTLGK